MDRNVGNTELNVYICIVTIMKETFHFLLLTLCISYRGKS